MESRTNQESHDARWVTSEDHRTTFTNLPKGWRPFDGKDERLRHQMGQMAIRCAHCDALHWIEERNTSSPRTCPNFTAGYSCGKVSLPPLAQPPSPLRDLLEGQTPEAKQFCNQIRKYSNSFAFTSVGAKIDQSMARGRVYTYRLQGELHHRMASLLPSEGETPKFAQIFIHDPQMQEDCQLNFREELHPDILHQLQTMLQDVNPYAQLYENARRRLSTHLAAPLSLRLVTLRNKDSRRYNTPTANEVGAIMVGDGTYIEEKTRDIIVKKKGGPLQRISILHPSYLPMHYALLFPHGCDGWHPNIPLTGFTNDNNAGGFMENPYENIQGQHGRGGSKCVTLNQFHAYTLHPRHDEHIFRARRLLQQFIVDGYACTEENCLHFLLQHKSNLRVYIDKGAQDAMYQGDTDAAQIGRKLILQSSSTGGSRQMTQVYQDAMGIVRNCGKPDIFLTFTYNTK